jgi:hypothetical protein
MKMVARVIRWKEPFEVTRIRHDLVQIRNSVEMARSAYPLIHFLPVGFVARSRLVVRTDIWENRCANDLYAVGMGAARQFREKGEIAT